MTEPVKLVPTKSDADIARELKAKIVEASAALCSAFDEAKSHGFVANFNIGPDWTGSHKILNLELLKKF